MELQKQMLEYIKANGLKKGFIASQVGISQPEFSLWLHGRTFINRDIEYKLQQIIKSWQGN